MPGPGNREWRYLALALPIVVVYAVVAATLQAGRDFAERGPLSHPSATTAEVPGGALTAAEALERCWPQRPLSTSDYVVVEGEVLGEWYLACHEVDPAFGDTEAVALVDANGTAVTDPEVLKAAGVWPWVAVVSTGRGLVAGLTVFAVRCTDEVWQRAVRQMTQTCDAVLIDVTDMTGHIAWELELLRDLGRLHDCIFLSRHGTEDASATAVEQQLGLTVHVHGFDSAGRLVAPRTFRHALGAVLFRATDQAVTGLRAQPGRWTAGVRPRAQGPASR